MTMSRSPSGESQVTEAPLRPGHWFWGSAREIQLDPLALNLNAQREQGDVVRFKAMHSFQWYSITHPDGVAQVLGKNHSNYRKPDFFLAAVRPVFGHGLFSAEGDDWKRKRRLIAPVFKRQKVFGLVDTIAEATMLALETWETLPREEPIDVLQTVTKITLQVAGLVFFGTDLQSDLEAFGVHLQEAFEAMNARMNTPMAAPMWLPTSNNRRLRRARGGLLETVRRIIAKRREDDSGETQDLLGWLIASESDEDSPLDDEELANEVITLLVAGHDTTAAALAWTLHLLAQNPEARTRAEAEADDVLAGRTPTIDDLPAFSYTKQCFEEAMRLYPPAWGIPRQSIAEDSIGGFRIPKGVIINLSQWATHRHPDFWPEPERFDPTRFDPEASKGRHPFAYFPFGAGPRVCVGRNLAMLEGPLILAMVLSRFRLHSCPERPPSCDTTFTLRPRNGLWMRLEHRS